MITFDDLNSNQQRAFRWNEGPLLVLAGPGSGKTEVLTLRIARLLKEDECASALALTFTNRAAAEMQDRVNRHLGGHTDRTRLCTFHAFAVDLLGQHGSHLGIRPNFGIARREDRITILEEAICNLSGGDAELPSDRINLLSLLDQLFSESYKGDGPSPSLIATPRWLPRLFRQYCDTLISFNRLDFGSLLHFANQLLRQKPAITRTVRLGWTHISVDEFQDTNRAQYDLLRRIAPDHRCNLFVVADGDQIIHQWNGANPKRLDDLRRDYQPQMIALPESYRCLPEIVDRANQLIDHNRGRLVHARKIVSVRLPQASAEVVRYRVFDDPSEEARFVGRDIRKRKLSPAECSVFGRTNQLVQLAADRLQRAGHEAFVPQTKSDFDSPAPGVLVEALRLANSRHDRIVLRRLCRQWDSLTGTMIESQAVEAAAALVGGDFLRAWIDMAEKAAAGQIALQPIRTGLVDGLDFPGIVDSFLRGEWRSWGDIDTEANTEEEVETWRVLHREIVGREPGTTLNTYLQRLDLESKAPSPTPNAIRCMTVHRSKGLQFAHVYVIGMAQGVFPSHWALQKGEESQEMEEERRSCFVAITRARETLTLTRAREYRQRPRQASQFLGEMGLHGPEGNARAVARALQPTAGSPPRSSPPSASAGPTGTAKTGPGR